MSKLPELRYFIEKSLKITNKDKFYDFFLKGISSSDYYKIFKSHLILHTLNLKFNFRFYFGFEDKFIYPLPKIINETIKKYGIKTSKLNIILWKFAIIKKIFKK